MYCGLGRTITFLDYHRRQLASTGDGDAKSVFHPRKELRIPKHWWTLNLGILLLDVNFSYICAYTYLYNKSNRSFGLPSMYKTSDQEERCWLNSAWFPLAMSFFPMMSSFLLLFWQFFRMYIHGADHAGKLRDRHPSTESFKSNFCLWNLLIKGGTFFFLKKSDVLTAR